MQKLVVTFSQHPQCRTQLLSNASALAKNGVKPVALSRTQSNLIKPNQTILSQDDRKFFGTKSPGGWKFKHKV
jgi:hypothetical protein